MLEQRTLSRTDLHNMQKLAIVSALRCNVLNALCQAGSDMHSVGSDYHCSLCSLCLGLQVKKWMCLHALYGNLCNVLQSIAACLREAPKASRHLQLALSVNQIKPGCGNAAHENMTDTAAS